jgi:hypothetical protein
MTTTTTTRSFLKKVQDASGKKLVFLLDGDPLVGPDYHVTEIKALSYHAMDCGGQADHWNETLVQLWNPQAREEGDFMRTGKFLDIYRRVASSIPVDENAEIRIEYGDLDRPAINYHVDGLEETEDRLLVHLRNPAVTCKARDRAALPASACCTPASSTAGASGTVLEPVLTVPSQDAGRGCC